MKRFLMTLTLFMISHTWLLAQSSSGELPRILLLGDSIRMGYTPGVTRLMQGQAEVFSPRENGGDTEATLAKLDEWLSSAKPTVIHWNNGLHDLKFSKANKTHQVPLEAYKKNLQRILARLQKKTPHVIFTTTTPIVDERHAARKADFDRFDADVQKYNAAAVEVMRGAGVPVHDLYRIVQDGDPAKMLGKDGTHYTPDGNARLSAAVADVLRRKLYLLNPLRRKAPDSGEAAAASYRKTEANLDAQVPAAFRSMKFPEFKLPRTASQWESQRKEVKEKVVASLGDLPARPMPPRTHLVSVEIHPGYHLERLQIDNGIDGVMSALMMVPEGVRKPAPTILWLHSSSYDHRQLLQPNSNGGEEPLGVTYMKRGWVVFAPDAAWYGDRAGQGPAGPVETTTNQQSSQLKYNLWFGRTLWGMFVRDDQVALDYLCSRPEVDTKRIGATGISMGSTRSWWLAAVDDRIACVVGVACLTRYENLIKHGQLKAHGLYYFVNGILKHFDTEAVISLIAPRPMLFLTGDLDAGSPVDGIRVIEEKVAAVYGILGAREKFRNVVYTNIGHTYTPKMREEMLAWFDRWLK